MKKLLAICLSVLLVCAAIPFAFATADEAATIVVSSVEGKAGDEVSVTVSLKNNPGLVSAKIKVGYDSAALELVNKAAGEFPGAGYSWGALTKNPFVINFCDAIAEADYNYELLATLTFKIKDDAAAGVYPLTIECDYEGDFYNLNWDVIEFEEEVGSVTVKGDEPVAPPAGPVVPETPVFTDPTVVIPNAGAQVGDEISVPVYLKNNPGLVSAKIKVGYDASALELIAKENGEFPGSGYSWGALTKNPFVINFCDAIAEADYTFELLATLTFKVLDGAAGEYPFTLECDYEGDFYNLNWDVIEFAEYAGVIVVGGGDAPVVPPVCEHEYDNDCDADCNKCGEIRPVHTEGIAHTAAVAAACHADGNIEYWYCAACDTYWSDAALTQVITAADIVVPATGADVQHVEAEEAGPAEAGNIEYWYCPECGQYWKDADLSESTTADEVIIPPVGVTPCDHEYDAACDPTCNKCGETRPVHTEGIIHYGAIEAGCHYIGNIEYWFCPECECFWADAALTQLTNSKNVIVPAKGGETIHFAAIAAGCHYNGQIEHWFCAECGQFWQDEALTQLTNGHNVILPAIGSENLQHIEAKAPTCSEAGNIEYWFCSDCEKYWQDENLTQLTNVKNVMIAPIDHNIVHMNAVEPGCHYIGNIEYWFCTNCEMFWQDAALTQITNSKNVILPATGGEVIAFEAIEPACHYNGRIAYWFCPECEQFWQDEALTQLTNSKNVILPAIGGDVEHVEAKAPTATENGNIEYWFCPVCEQFWQDEALTQLTNSKNVIIGALGENPCEHNIVHMDAVAPGCHYIGNIEYWFCTACEIFWQDAELTQLTNSKNVILPAIGGDVIHFEAIEPSCHYNGHIEYWFCPDCEQFWQDEALTQLTNSKNVILPATGGELVHIDAVEPGCHYDGNIEYWFCDACEQFWQDEALTQLTNSKNVILPATGGDVVHFEAVAPACHYNGNIEYWFCPECEKFWADEALTQLTNSKNVILPAIGGEVIHVPAVAPTESMNGNIEYWYCEECEQFWTDAALTQLTNSKNVILPATGVDSPVTGDNIIVVVVALLTLVATGAAIVLVKNKKHA